MKIKLWCKILGHTFIARRDEFMDGEHWTKYYRINFCTHCGLTKEEAGITRPNNT